MGKSDKPKSCGSIYFNVKKGTPDSFRKKLQKFVKALTKSEKVYLSISIAKKGTDTYTKYSAFFNGFKDSPKKPDMFIRPTEVAREVEDDEDDTDDLDLGGDEDTDEDEDEKPAKKAKKKVKEEVEDDEEEEADEEDEDDSDEIPF